MSDDQPVLFTVNVAEGALHTPSILVHTTPNLAFQAEQFEERFCTAVDGSTRRIIVRSNIHRFSDGHLRVEWTPPGTEIGPGITLSPSFVSVYDPTGRLVFGLMTPPRIVHYPPDDVMVNPP